MNILYIGAGFVGACSAAVSANSGHKTLVYDISEKRIGMLGSGDRDVIESCLFEKGLGDMIVRERDRVRFTADYGEVVSFLDECDAVFMCLPTPEIGETGETDLSYYNSAAEQLMQALAGRNGGAQTKYIVIVNKSTVPIDMLDRTEEMARRLGVENFGLASNPEFLVEGKAMEGALRPNRVVVGAKDDAAFDVMRSIYQRFYDSPQTPYLEVNPREAEAGKLLANFYLFHKLAACFDVIGRVSEAFDGVKFEHVRKIITSDSRIGSWGFYNSLYAGGSCLIKDARSLSYQLQTAGESAVLVDEVYFANKRQLELFLSRAEKQAHFSWKGKVVSLLGLSFKRDTNDTRNSPSIDIVKFLLEKQVRAIHVYDPAAADNFRELFPASEQIIYFQHEFDAVKDTDAIVIATDWPQFRGLADTIIAELDARPLIMDGRRMLQHRYADLQKAGFPIVAVGSPFISS